MKNKLSVSPGTDKKNFQQDDFFCSFFKEHENHLYGCDPVQPYPANTQIFQQDTPANAVYLVERGLVKLSRVELSRQIIVGLRSRHWLLGAPAVLIEKSYSFSATTLTLCYLRTISAKGFLHLAKTDAQFSYQLQQMLSQEIYNHLIKVITLGCLPAIDRLERFFCELIQEHEPTDLQRQIEIQVPLKNQEIAEMIAVTPEHLCRLLKGMAQKTGVKLSKGVLTIMNPLSLMHKANI
jgi:CRP-like cAMP-binding protein